MAAAGQCQLVRMRSTRIVPVGAQQSSVWQGKTLVLSQRPSAGFVPMTAGKAMFGPIGAVAMIEAGKDMVASNDIADPTPGVGEALLAAAAQQRGLVPSQRPPIAIDTTDVPKLAAASKGADLLFDAGDWLGIRLQT